MMKIKFHTTGQRGVDGIHGVPLATPTVSYKSELKPLRTAAIKRGLHARYTGQSRVMYTSELAHRIVSAAK